MQTKINKRAVQASFSKAATYYDQYADLQREIGHHLITMVPTPVDKTINILDLGCGTGYFSEILSQKYANSHESAQLTCFDLSLEMLNQASQRNIKNSEFIEGDIDNLPFKSSCFDLIFSNLVVQWSEQLSASLSQTKLTLNDSGTYCFSTLLTGTLMELKQAWKHVDQFDHVNSFLDESEVRHAITKAGFKNYRLEIETRIKKFPNVISVMKALKGIGANHVHQAVKPKLSGRQLLQKIEQGYQPFIDQDGFYNLTYQVCYVVAINEG